MNRHDWLSAFNNELGWTIAVERLLGIEVPERAQWIRTMMAEWNRILNHLMFCGSFPLELGAMTPMFYAFREREMIQNLMESGHRRADAPFVRADRRAEGRPPAGFLKQSADVLAVGPGEAPRLREPDHGQRDHPRAHQGRRACSRPRSPSAYGASGPVLHASGVPMDPRKDEPYEKYGEVEFDVPIGRNGDSYDRLWVLVQRMWESCKIIEQCMDKLPPGDVHRAEAPQAHARSPRARSTFGPRTRSG